MPNYELISKTETVQRRLKWWPLDIQELSSYDIAHFALYSLFFFFFFFLEERDEIFTIEIKCIKFCVKWISFFSKFFRSAGNAATGRELPTW